jgi:hypothetical protein
MGLSPQGGDEITQESLGKICADGFFASNTSGVEATHSEPAAEQGAVWLCTGRKLHLGEATVERRARVQPCHKWSARMTALEAAEVRFSILAGQN